MSIPGKKIVTAALAIGAALAITPVASADVDTTPPSVPQNLHDTSLLLQSGNAVLSWDPSTDTGSGVNGYSVLIDGSQRARPRSTTYDIETLVLLNRISPGPHVVTVEAVDFAQNRSAPSAPINIVVVS
jgi:hypothetical protein